MVNEESATGSGDAKAKPTLSPGQEFDVEHICFGFDPHVVNSFNTDKKRLTLLPPGRWSHKHVPV